MAQSTGNRLRLFSQPNQISNMPRLKTTKCFETITAKAKEMNPELWYAMAVFKCNGKGDAELRQLAYCNNEELDQLGDCPYDFTPKMKITFFLN